MRPKIYIAGPYSNAPEYNVGIAIAWWHEVYQAGGDPFLPHLSHFVHRNRPIDYESWIAFDMRWLDVCDALFRFGGESPGAERELQSASLAGKPAFLQDEFGNLKKWICEYGGRLDKDA